MLLLFFYNSPCPLILKLCLRLTLNLRAAQVCLCRSFPVTGCSSERFQFDFLMGGGLPGAFRVSLRVSNYVRGIKCICDWFCAGAERDAAVSLRDMKLRLPGEGELLRNRGYFLQWGAKDGSVPVSQAR